MWKIQKFRLNSSVPKRGGGRLCERSSSERHVSGSYASLRCLIHIWLLGKIATFQVLSPLPLSGKGTEHELRGGGELPLPSRCELSYQTASLGALLSEGGKDEGEEER